MEFFPHPPNSFQLWVEPHAPLQVHRHLYRQDCHWTVPWFQLRHAIGGHASIHPKQKKRYSSQIQAVQKRWKHSRKSSALVSITCEKNENFAARKRILQQVEEPPGSCQPRCAERAKKLPDYALCVRKSGPTRSLVILQGWVLKQMTLFWSSVNCHFHPFSYMFIQYHLYPLDWKCWHQVGDV